MKLTTGAVNVLKNFSGINTSLVIKKGVLQRTISSDETILAEATIEDDFPMDFAIYDLNQFLKNVTTLDNPEITFNENHAVIQNGNMKINYYACAANLIDSPPDGKSIVVKNPDASFSISKNSLQKLLMVSTMNELNIVNIVGKQGKLSLQSYEYGNDSSNRATLELGDYNGAEFEAKVKLENLKMILDDYDVTIKTGAFSCWENSKKTLKYVIGLEKK